MLGATICLLGMLCFPLALVVGWLSWFPLHYVIGAVTLCARLPLAWLSTAGWPLSVPLAWGYYLALASALGLGWHSYSRCLAPSAGAGPRWTQADHPQSGKGHGRARGLLLGTQMALALWLLLATGLQALLGGGDAGLVVTVFSLAAPSGVSGPAILVQMPQGKICLIDGGPDAVALAHALDRRLPFWQRRLDWLVLSSPLLSHLAGLQDATARFEIGQALDGGVLHPGTGYALWRRTLRTRDIPYRTLRQGQVLGLGQDLRLEALWPPASLHRGGDEARNNALVLRLVTPGLRILLLGEAAQSAYALNGLLATARSTSLDQVDVVLAALAADQKPPPALFHLLEQVRPSLLVVDIPPDRPAGRPSRSPLPIPSPPPVRTPAARTAGSLPSSVPASLVGRVFWLKAPAAFSLQRRPPGWSFGLVPP